MELVKLVRFDQSDQGTFGKVVYKGHVRYTLELPWRDNKSNISCFPPGTYKVVWTPSNRFKRYMYEVVGVPNRAGIRIHSSNLAGDTQKGYKAQLQGCIALGERIGYIGKQKALLVSKPAVSHLELIMEGKPFMLEVL